MDKNLKIAILENCKSLQDEYKFGWDADYEEFCVKNFGEPITDNEYEPSERIVQFFLNLSIPQNDLDSIKSLVLDGDKSIYTFIVEDFANNDDFYINSLEGIENCVNLKKLDLNSMVRNAGLKPLAKLNNLEELSIDFYNTKDYETFLEIPNLKKLEVSNIASFEEIDRKKLQEIIEKLKNKGVEIVI